MIARRLPPTATRVERMTVPEVNARIRTRANARVASLERAKPSQMAGQLAAREREWDVERVLQANASTLVLLGLVLGAKVDRRFLLLPTAVLGFFGLHALQGWCPPVPILRRRGIRTAREIERERYAIKALRGDFDNVPQAGRSQAETRMSAVLEAVDR
jgi:hypothetical protein